MPTDTDGHPRRPGNHASVGGWAGLAWALWALVMAGFVVVLWLDGLLRRVGRPDLVSVSGDAVPYLLAMVSAATVGAVLAGRRPRHPVGWLLLAIGVSVIVLGVSDAYAAYGLLARPGSLPGAVWAAVYVDVSWVVLSTLLGFVLLLTPTGSLPSPRWRWWARVVVAAAVIGVTLPTRPLDPPYQAVAIPLVESGPLTILAGLADIVSLVALLVAAGSLVRRFRRAQGVERLQLRWVTAAAAMAGILVAVILGTWLTMASAAQPLWGWATGIYLAVLPLATGAAILRYRLYDLDRIVSRTVAYGLLTVVLGLGYAGAALVLGQLFGGLGGRPPSWAVAAVTIAAFGVRLREQVDLDSLSAELLAVTHQTMQPTTVSLWLRARP